MSLKTDSIVIKEETTAGANTAVRIGTLFEDIADTIGDVETILLSI